MYLLPSLEEQFYLLRYCAESPAPQRKARRRSHFRVLYQLHLLQKNVIRGAWTSVFTATGTIARYAHINRSTAETFINHPSFSIFCEVERRKGKTHRYRLRDWVINYFNAFERLGMMRGFQTDFNVWFDRFCKRCDRGFLPVLQKCESLNEVVNRLSTKLRLKSSRSEVLKSSTTTNTSYCSLTTPSGIRSNPESPNPVVKGFVNVSRELENRFQIKGNDLIFFTRTYSLNTLHRALGINETWKTRGMEITSPVKTFQTCINVALRK